MARRAACFRREVTVWQVDGVELRPPDPQVPEPPPPVPDFHPLVQLMRDVGLEVVADNDAIVGEFNGLEVARLVAQDDGHRLDVGVGAYDQDAFALMHADLEPHDALATVLAEVQRHRVRGAAPHPINRLVRERWLRAELVADPSRVGAVALAPVASMVERDGLHDILPAAAVGSDGDDRRLLVVCSVGIDLDLVPTAGELASYSDVDQVVFVLPERDHHPVTVAMAEELNWPVRFDIADCPWPPG